MSALLFAACPAAVVGQSAAHFLPYRDSIPGTLVSFEMIPVPGGTVTLDTPQGPRTVSVGPFWIGKTEVTWDEYDIWAFRLDLAGRVPTDSIDAVSRPSRPYGAPDRGFGHQGYPAIGMTYFAAQTYCAWLSAKTGKRYRLATDVEWSRAVQAGLGAAHPVLEPGGHLLDALVQRVEGLVQPAGVRHQVLAPGRAEHGRLRGPQPPDPHQQHRDEQQRGHRHRRRTERNEADRIRQVVHGPSVYERRNRPLSPG